MENSKREICRLKNEFIIKKRYVVIPECNVKSQNCHATSQPPMWRRLQEKEPKLILSILLKKVFKYIFFNNWPLKWRDPYKSSLGSSIFLSPSIFTFVTGVLPCGPCLPHLITKPNSIPSDNFNKVHSNRL